MKIIPTDGVSRTAWAILNEALKQGLVHPTDCEAIRLNAVELLGTADFVALARAALKITASESELS